MKKYGKHLTQVCRKYERFNKNLNKLRNFIMISTQQNTRLGLIKKLNDSKLNRFNPFLKE